MLRGEIPKRKAQPFLIPSLDKILLLEPEKISGSKN